MLYNVLRTKCLYPVMKVTFGSCLEVTHAYGHITYYACSTSSNQATVEERCAEYAQQLELCGHKAEDDIQLVRPSVRSVLSTTPAVFKRAGGRDGGMEGGSVVGLVGPMVDGWSGWVNGLMGGLMLSKSAESSVSDGSMDGCSPGVRNRAFQIG